MTATQAPWAELAASLVRAGKQIDGIASREDTLARADGHAQLGTLLEIALRWYLRGADPDFPRSPGKRWILKSPPHLLSLDALVNVFPDAKPVMTHRHPRLSVGSKLKLVELAQRQFARKVDRDRIRDVWLRNLSLAIERFMDFRARHGDERFVHVAFRDFVTDPLPAIERIYAFAGALVTAETRAAVAHWHDENPRHADGRFDYDLAEFGLTDDMIDHVFAPHLSEFAA